MRESVSFALAGNLFDDAGRLHDPAPAAQAADTLLNQLSWWAVALREARAARPYGG